MNTPKIIVAVLVALAFALNIPSELLAQSDQTVRQIPQPKGGIATVIGVDQPENCLRIRSGPGTSYDVIGCANMGDQLNITGVWTSNDWAQLADNGWVYGPQIETDLRPPRAAYSRGVSYAVSEVVTPNYDDWSYLPDYGYDTYWYGGIPIFLYNIGVWYRFHPWWWHRGHQAWWWKDGHRGRRAWNPVAFNNYVRGGAHKHFVTNRSNSPSVTRAWKERRFTTNRSNISSLNSRGWNQRTLTTNRSNSPSLNRTWNDRRFTTNRANTSSVNVSQLNTNRFPSGSSNAIRSRAFSNATTFRSGSASAFRSPSFSSPRTFRSSSVGGSQLSGFARSGGFSSARMGGGSFRFGGGAVGRMGGGRR